MSCKKIFIAGFGGQGILLLGKMLSYAAMYDGKNVTFIPSYGPEMRGGTANCTVCISDTAIASPLITTCDILVAMNGPSLDRFEDMLLPGGELFINSSFIEKKSERNDINVNYVDCMSIAEKIVHNGKAANMVMLGAIIRKTGVVSIEIMDTVFEKVLTGEKAKLIPINKKALASWEY